MSFTQNNESVFIDLYTIFGSLSFCIPTMRFHSLNISIFLLMIGGTLSMSPSMPFFGGKFIYSQIHRIAVLWTWSVFILAVTANTRSIVHYETDTTFIQFFGMSYTLDYFASLFFPGYLILFLQFVLS